MITLLWIPLSWEHTELKHLSRLNRIKFRAFTITPNVTTLLEDKETLMSGVLLLSIKEKLGNASSKRMLSRRPLMLKPTILNLPKPSSRKNLWIKLKTWSVLMNASKCSTKWPWKACKSRWTMLTTVIIKLNSDNSLNRVSMLRTSYTISRNKMRDNSIKTWYSVIELLLMLTTRTTLLRNSRLSKF